MSNKNNSLLENMRTFSVGFTSCNAQKVIHRVTRKRWIKASKACNKADLK